jgi:hypothetical protein
MFVGHFAVAFLAKRAEPNISLGTLILAAMLPDLLSDAFLLGGIEHIEIGHGSGAANYFHATQIAYSHSLAAGVLWGALFAGTYYHRRRSAAIIFGLVLSHWVLDVISHRPDMPLVPGLDLRLGLGLWSSIPATLVIEGGLWLIAILVYLRGRARNRLAPLVLWPGVAILTLLWYNNSAGPPPPNVQTMEIGGAIIFTLFVAWGYWLNLLRE